MLYPIKFKPQFLHRLWGGRSLETLLKKKLPIDQKIGESWEISAVEDNLSVVSNGILKGNNIEELIEIYMSDVVGEKVYDKFGIEFPLLIKFLDADEILSIQVHPNDELAKELHNSYGKTEMWYIISAEKDAEIFLGFKQETSKEDYVQACIDGNLPSLLNNFKVKPGDCYFIPSGTIHAIGKGITLAEVQQTSDITYRVNDWNRLDSNGEPRDLHEAEAFAAIDFSTPQNYNITKPSIANQSVEITKCNYYTVNLIEVDGNIERDYSKLDSFVIYIVVEGSIEFEDTKAKKGESILIPAIFEDITIKGQAKILEVYID